MLLWMSPQGWDRMKPSAAVKARAEATRRQLLELSFRERTELRMRRRRRQALYDFWMSSAFAIALLSLMTLAVACYTATRGWP